MNGEKDPKEPSPTFHHVRVLERTAVCSPEEGFTRAQPLWDPILVAQSPEM